MGSIRGCTAGGDPCLGSGFRLPPEAAGEGPVTGWLPKGVFPATPPCGAFARFSGLYFTSKSMLGRGNRDLSMVWVVGRLRDLRLSRLDCSSVNEIFFPSFE